MAAGLAHLRDLDICGCEQLAEDAIVALSALRALTQLNVGSCQQAVTNRQATAPALFTWSSTMLAHQTLSGYIDRNIQVNCS